VDVYGYGMTYYEVLIGEVLFEDHPQNDYDLVLQWPPTRVAKVCRWLVEQITK
jgi:hypothetical protein